jgi:segregation and condensation protein B
VERKFVRVAGRKESPGRPFLYGTTNEFLRHFGLKSIEALPPMAQPTLTEPAAEPELQPAMATESAAPESAASSGTAPSQEPTAPDA